MRRLEIAHHTPVFSECQRAANKYRHASHEARYVVIYACSKSNEQSLRYSHFLGSSTGRITLYIPHSILHLAWLLCVRSETFEPY